MSNTALSGNLSKKVAYANVPNFMLLRKFNVKLNPPKAPQVIEIIWHPPLPNWTKCNTDGSTINNLSTCGGIFRNSRSKYLLCFSESTGLGNALHAELSGAMRAIELAHTHNWYNFCLEADFELVIKVVKNSHLVPWKLKNRWMNCMILSSQMNFLVTHIYREGNQCADILANLGHNIDNLFLVVYNIDNLTIWFHVPDCISSSYGRNRLGLLSFRFVTH